MFKRLLRSRGSKKFRKNRLAMASLTVILAYCVVGLWVAGTNTVNDYVVNIEDRPVLGLFVRDQVARAIAPKELPGFGLAPDGDTLRSAYAEYLGIAERGFEAVDRLEPDSDRSWRDVLDRDYAWSSRPFAEVPLEELRARYAEADAERDAIVADRLAVSGLDRLRDLGAEALAKRESALGMLTPETDREALGDAIETLGFAVGEFADAALAYTATAGDSDPIAAQHPGDLKDLGLDLEDAAYELFDGEGALTEDDLAVAKDAIERFNPERVDGITEAIGGAAAGLDARVAERMDRLGPMIEALFPPPEGVRGVVYRVRMAFGTDKQGRSIFIRAIYSAKVAIQVGLVTGLFAVLFGGVFGAAAAFYGGWVDHVFNWLYSMITSVPYLVLLAVLSFLFLGSPLERTLIPLYVAFGVTYWVGPARVIRGEALKIKELEYVQAATAIGFGRFYILLKHVIPNTSHLLFINFSLLFIAAIKGEVILTFLGLGLKDGASWGIMIQQSGEQVVNEFFWQIGAATLFMLILVLAFNIFTDALQDAFDPKHVS